MGLAVRKKKGAHRGGGQVLDLPHCQQTPMSIRRAAVHGEHYTHAAKKSNCAHFASHFALSCGFFLFVLKLMYTRSQPLTYTKCGCTLKKSLDRQAHAEHLAAALRFAADIISMPIFCSRKTNVLFIYTSCKNVQVFCVEGLWYDFNINEISSNLD